jgi:hypothetical protein
MKEACKVIKQTTGDVIDLDTLPIDDELTYQLYQRGQTIGTFHFFLILIVYIVHSTFASSEVI